MHRDSQNGKPKKHAPNEKTEPPEKDRPDTELKTMAVRMPKERRGRVDELRKNLTKARKQKKGPVRGEEYDI